VPLTRSRAAVLAATLLVCVALAADPALPRRVVMISFDAAGGLELSRRLAHGDLGPDGFARARREGLSAERLAVVFPAQTAVAHMSMSTGAYPDQTGFVANGFHKWGQPLLSRVNAFDSVPDVETLWEAALRQGKRVASLSWPTVTQHHPRLTTPLALPWPDTTPAGAFWKPEADTALADAAVALPLGSRSFSPPKALPAPLGAGLAAVAVDGSDDGRRNYDRVLVLDGRGELVASPRPGEWFAVEQRLPEQGGRRDVLKGRWCKLLALSADLSAVSLYVGAEGSTPAAPDDFRRTLDKRAGFWPGNPDVRFLGDPSPDPTSYLEQIVRLSDYFNVAFEVAARRGDWDLLLGYQPGIDEATHALLLTDPRQPGYSAERSARYLSALRDAWRAADRAAAGYLRFAGRGDVVFVSDHGQRPAYRSFYLAEALRQKGWLKAEERPSTRGSGTRFVTTSDSPTSIFVDGATGFIVVNRRDTMPGGVVLRDRVNTFVNEMAAYLKSLRDPDGSPVLAIVARPSEVPEMHVNSPNAGELLVVAAEGTSMRSELPVTPGSLFSYPLDLGKHGLLPHPELDGIFLHVGEGIAPSQVVEVRQVEVARRISERLGIEPPKAAH